MKRRSPTAPSTARLDDAAVLLALTTERLALCTRLDELDDASWSVPTPCSGWTVKDVVAHLTLSTRQTAIDFVRGMVRHRGNFDRMNAEQARSWSVQHTTAELLDLLRESAGSRQTSFGSSYRDGLIDVIVHGQDIARPLGALWIVPPADVVVALDHALSNRWYGAPKRLAHATLVATDLDWTWGSGPSQIVGPCIDLLLVATGRPEGMDNLTGPGLAELTARFST
jgi:uncharacterized protein (TIGR03083 family)